MQLNGAQTELFSEALLNAFSLQTLERMVFQDLVRRGEDDTQWRQDQHQISISGRGLHGKADLRGK